MTTRREEAPIPTCVMAAAFAMSACGGDAPFEQAALSVTDSAGVRIIDIQTAALTDLNEFRLSEGPTLTFDTSESHQFFPCDRRITAFQRKHSDR